MEKHYIPKLLKTGSLNSYIISQVASNIEDYINSEFTKPLSINYKTYGLLTSIEEENISNINSINNVAKALWNKQLKSQNRIIIQRDSFGDEDEVVVGIGDRGNFFKYVEDYLKDAKRVFDLAVIAKEYPINPLDLESLKIAEEQIGFFEKNSLEEILLKKIIPTIKQDRKDLIYTSKLYLKLARNFSNDVNLAIELAERLPFKLLSYAFQEVEFISKNGERILNHLKSNGINDSNHPLYGKELKELSENDKIDLLIYNSNKKFEKNKKLREESQILFKSQKPVVYLCENYRKDIPDTVGHKMGRPNLAGLEKDFN